MVNHYLSELYRVTSKKLEKKEKLKFTRRMIFVMLDAHELNTQNLA